MKESTIKAITQIPLLEGIPPQEIATNKRHIELEKNKLAIYFPYNPMLVEGVRGLSGRKYRPDDHAWLIPIASCDEVLQFAERHGFYINREAQQAITEHKRKLEENKKASSAIYSDIEIEGLNGELRPFQKAGVAYAVKNRSVFIADEMGLGKTIESLATIQATRSFPAVVICPASLKLNWEREALKWLPNHTVQVLSGRSDKVRKDDITILNYEILQYYMQQLHDMKPQAIIFDESHYLKNYKAKRTQYAKKLARRIPIRLALTGTPVLSRPKELLTQLQVLGRLSDLGGFWPFMNRYCAPVEGRWGASYDGASNTEELHEKLQSICYIRRRKEDVLKELPDKQRTIVPIEVNASSYNREEDLFLTSPNAHKPGMGVTEMEALKLKVAWLKLDMIEEWIREFIEAEKLVVFANHIEIQQELLRRFPGAAHILGTDSMEARDRNVQQFQNDPNTKLAICSLKAAGVGLTLTAASNVAFIELGWTPAEHDQAEDRLHRIGQKNSVNCWYFIGKDTIDESIMSVLDAKRQVVGEVTDGKNAKEIQTYKAIMKDLLKRRAQKNQKRR